MQIATYVRSMDLEMFKNQYVCMCIWIFVFQPHTHKTGLLLKLVVARILYMEKLESENFRHFHDFAFNHKKFC